MPTFYENYPDMSEGPKWTNEEVLEMRESTGLGMQQCKHAIKKDYMQDVILATDLDSCSDEIARKNILAILKVLVEKY